MLKTFDEVFDDYTKYGTKIKTEQYHTIGTNIIIDQGQADIAGYTDQIDGLFKDVPVIVFGDHTRIIKYINRPFFLGADGTKILKSKIPDANYKYLYYALKNAKIPNTGYNRHFKWLKQISISYPEHEKQSMIVEILDKLEDSIDNYNTILGLLDKLVKARFIEMFGSIHDSKIFVYYPLKEITTVCSGGTPNRDNKAYWESGTIPWVKTTELKNNRLTHVEEFITELGLEESSAKLVPSDTVLIAMYGQGKTRGMTGYLEIEATTNQACACILPTNKMNMIYLWKYFELSYDKLRELAKGGNQPNLNCTMIRDFNILVPPIELQNQYADFVRHVDKSREAVKKSLEKTQQLYDSLMQEYFG